MTMRFKSSLCSMIIGGVLAGVSLVGGDAKAATLTFDTWTDTDASSTDPVVTIQELGSSQFNVNFSITAPPSLPGSLITMYFDIGDSDASGISASNFSPSSAAATQFVQPVTFPPLDNNENLNPNTDTGWDFALSFDKFDGIGSTIASLSFKLTDSNTLLALADFLKVGLRLQEVGLNGGGSDKLVGVDPTMSGGNIPVVPLPAPALLLLTGLGGLGGLAAFRRRRPSA